MSISSAAGFVALLSDEPELRTYALENLDKLVDEFWAEIADSVGKIEVLAEDDSFPARDLASLVASKVYYHLEQFELSMRFALGARQRFDIFGKKSEFVETLVAKFVDEYIKQRVQQAEAKDEKEKRKVDERLERIVGNMFDRCFKEGDFKPALGIAVESRRLDKIREAIKLASDRPAMLAYAYRICMNQVTSREFRQEVLQILVALYQEQAEVDYLNVVNCLVFLDDIPRVASIVSTLLKGDETQALLAYQIAFDLVENATQEFRITVRDSLAGPATANAGATAMEVDAGPEATFAQRAKQFKSILSGEVPIGLTLEFLSRNNHADLMILKNIKTIVEARNSVTHQATIFANALMHAGTTRDQFLRENIEWLAKATNWAKFSATAGLGVIHKGHLKEGLTLLGPYLPQAAGASSSPYSEGGALYALGIIHANHGGDIVKYLLNALRVASETNINDVVQHGACLGLGLAAMATRSSEIYEALKTVMYTDNAVAGEASGIAMGLVMLGSASQEALSDMLTYAHETQHEKIIRGLAMGIALIMYSREEQADTLIEQLCMDKDPILRYGGMYTVGLAYAGTANSRALKRLLHVAVSDVSDDVRRAAVINLGFLLFRQPRECPRLVQLLAASYNPHVRYGAALAVGIACSGSSSKDALDLLEPLTSDATDFVRQGALIAVAMVLMETNKVQEPRSETFRTAFAERVGDKHEELMAKFGSILAAGVIDAGGRNVTLSLASRSGHTNMVGIVGVALFTQMWYWYPLIHMISLAFAPTAVIGLNKDLKMPKMSFKCNARPSLFAYPPDVKPPEKKEITKVATAVLSTAAKTKARKKEEADKMEITNGAGAASPAPSPANPGVAAAAAATPVGASPSAAPAAGSAPAAPSSDKDKKEEEPKKDEPTSEILQNPARVTPTQVKFISFDVDERYTPIRKDAHGFVLLRDNKPGTPEELVGNLPPPAPAPAPVLPPSSPAPSPAATGNVGEEPAPPEAFEYTE